MVLGGGCGDCEIVVGDGCLPCPHGSDFPECAGCIDGMRAERTDVAKDLVLPIVIGVATTLAITLIAKKIMG